MPQRFPCLCRNTQQIVEAPQNPKRALGRINTGGLGLYRKIARGALRVLSFSRLAELSCPQSCPQTLSWEGFILASCIGGESLGRNSKTRRKRHQLSSPYFVEFSWAHHWETQLPE